MERKAAGDDPWEQVQRSHSSVVVVDMVQVDGKAPDDFRNALVPGRIVDGTIDVVHSRGVGVLFGLLTEYSCVQQHVGDVSKVMILDLDGVFGI